MGQWETVLRLIGEVFPRVNLALEKWRHRAEEIPDPVLREQALASIGAKRFHCQGGSVYALYPGVNRDTMVRFIVAFQTISDFLDNLCDRAGCEEEESFRKLHRAMSEALSPGGSVSDYYACYPWKNDGGYLRALVEECRLCLSGFPSYPAVQPETEELASLYSVLQSLKHIAPDRRERKMVDWASPYLKIYRDISVWEFAAAAGSTLGVFMLCAASCAPGLGEEEARKIKHAYFPYICGFHILLDYFIDQEEDRQEGDLNFFVYYQDQSQIKERLAYFLHHALAQARLLDFSPFQIAIVEGMTALYLSDVKASHGFGKQAAHDLLRAAGLRAKLWFLICRLLRKTGAI